jgi:hypothetical protein
MTTDPKYLSGLAPPKLAPNAALSAPKHLDQANKRVTVRRILL